MRGRLHDGGRLLGPPALVARAARPVATTRAMGGHDVDGLNAGYAELLLDEYLENPDAVPEEWRALFESGDSELVATQPGLVRLLGRTGWTDVEVLGTFNDHVVVSCSGGPL